MTRKQAPLHSTSLLGGAGGGGVVVYLTGAQEGRLAVTSACSSVDQPPPLLLPLLSPPAPAPLQWTGRTDCSLQMSRLSLRNNNRLMLETSSGTLCSWPIHQSLWSGRTGSYKLRISWLSLRNNNWLTLETSSGNLICYWPI